MKSKEYEMPDGRKAVFEYDENGVGKITLECMDMLMGLINDRKTENSSEKPNNCKDEPQTYKINPKEPTNMPKCFDCEDFFTCDGQCEIECEKCKHFREEADTYMKQCEFYFMECRFEPKDEPQTMYYPQVDGITPSVIEPKFDKDINVRSKYKQGTWLYGNGVYCSCCGYKLETTALLAKCPKCGADMSKTDCAWK